jgi:predicted metal-dependent enzyme (double-stranded beta helix superfamily)
MEYFEKLGSETGRLWKKLNYDERRFPEVATDVLTQMPSSRHTSFEEVVRYALMSETLPYQADPGASFGQPPLTVYESRGFRVEVLFWTGVTPSIHQHAFSGAFHVMHGSSIHISWGFDFQERVSTHFHYGRVDMKKAELLKLGDIRPIVAGTGFIHTTFHLDLPTVSVVVRTTNEQDQLPQYSFYPPSIAYNTRDNESYLRRKSQILAMLINLRSF